ncbi:hypothetical protein FSP39_015878 [Pinctada imbricata]|uniref:G-protein coupled receptors family 1 profile domain-containing protein n=1 Tax=Pinctada imbricata TaxID=66713 RepID=A0AA88Y1F3_PINIB|nr:hypothetical protein FSP39_015878 [Pinctada imbricata]
MHWEYSSDPDMEDRNFTTFEELIEEYDKSLYTYDHPDKVVLLCIYIPVFLFALVGNFLVLVMVCVQRSARRNVANRFLVNLAVADLLGIYVEGSVLTIVCMSAERYVAIRHPMRIRTLCSEKRITQAIILTWITAIIIMIPLVIFKRLYIEYPLGMKDLLQIPYCLERWPSEYGRKSYNIFLLFIVYIIPGIIVMVLYSRIGCSLWRQDHDLQRANSCINNDSKVMGSRRKLARMMIVVSLLFAVCWMPYFILLVSSDFIKEAEAQRTMNSIYPFALLLGHSNSAQNPILYCFMHRGFHNFVRNLFFCQCDRMKASRMV